MWCLSHWLVWVSMESTVISSLLNQLETIISNTFHIKHDYESVSSLGGVRLICKRSHYQIIWADWKVPEQICPLIVRGDESDPGVWAQLKWGEERLVAGHASAQIGLHLPLLEHKAQSLSVIYWVSKLNSTGWVIKRDLTLKPIPENRFFLQFTEEIDGWKLMHLILLLVSPMPLSLYANTHM